MNNEPVHNNNKTNFVKPTELEVKTQFEIKGVYDQIEPQKFYAYYETVGWVVGRKKMRSWRAAVAGWCLRMEQFNNNKNQANDKFSQQATKERMASSYQYFKQSSNG